MDYVIGESEKKTTETLIEDIKKRKN